MVDGKEPPSLAPTRHGSLSTTMPEDRDEEGEAQEQEGTEAETQEAGPQSSTPAVSRHLSSPSPAFSFSPSSMDRYKDDDKDAAVAAALLAVLTTFLSTHLLPHIPPLLYDPLPLYTYRTSGEGRALAVSVLFLPGEWVRQWQGRVRRGGREGFTFMKWEISPG